ncbi:hypothetical protein [Marininema halotolerans]|uniref:Uncharacterized protein n=1 Tax=Marininema halotolerans TaxID=1155944 RepID=A0A1I6NUG9_9BACL|nr:hypothetical protein [Marininema halotolerans]SFS31583.1 hypothetical protein SAMN05444972_101144 [Marininema halotolerans]
MKGNPIVVYLTLLSVFFIIMGNGLYPYYANAISIGIIGGFVLIIVAFVIALRDAINKKR